MQDARPWVPEGDGHRCARHGVSFGALETCAKCEGDPGPELDAEADDAIPKAPEGCETSVDHEREFTAVARYADARGRELEKTGKSSKTQNVAAKWAEVSLRARRAAAELALRREDEHLVRARERRLRERGHGAAH